MNPLNRSLVVFAGFMLSILLAILTTASVADAAGFPHVDFRNRQDIPYIFLRVGLGFLLGITYFVLYLIATHLLDNSVTSIVNTSHRLDVKQANLLIVLGTGCLITALAFEWYVVAASNIVQPAGANPQFQFKSNSGQFGFDLHGSNQIQISKGSHPLSHLMAIALFVAGSGMISLGVWSSLGRNNSPPTLVVE